ncbi:colorectal mutant cancer protein [Trichonephila clavipes]|nr:colorectal mutant cancer protein [Trichonephila clavipes]
MFVSGHDVCRISVYANIVDECLQSEDITRMDWPAYSPDLNPIEHVWDMLGRRQLQPVNPSHLSPELRRALLDEWCNIPQDQIDNLILSMPRRFKSDEENQEKIMELLKESQENRKSAENMARHFLQKLDRSYGISCRMGGCHISPWEDLSSHSHTTSTSSSVSSSCDGGEFSKADERRLRDYITQLKNDRSAVRTTVVELESVYVDPTSKDPPPIIDAQKLDLENAVLMQELMAIKEEKAEFKAQVYLLEKEKTSLELQLNSREAQEQAYLVQIEHFKSELQEQAEVIEKLKSSNSNKKTLNIDESEATEKVNKLKARIQELVQTIEKVTKNSEMSAQQSVEFVNDLKRTNSALVIAFEKAKKKQQTKVKKLELQMSSLTERHNAQVRMLKQRIAMLEGETGHRLLQTSSSSDLPI